MLGGHQGVLWVLGGTIRARKGAWGGAMGAERVPWELEGGPQGAGGAPTGAERALGGSHGCRVGVGAPFPWGCSLGGMGILRG